MRLVILFYLVVRVSSIGNDILRYILWIMKLDLKSGVDIEEKGRVL